MNFIEQIFYMPSNLEVLQLPHEDDTQHKVTKNKQKQKQNHNTAKDIYMRH